VLTNLTDYANIFAYLGGFGIGTLLGMEVENRISIGYVIVRLITPADPQPMITRLANLGYGMTRIEGKGVTQNPVSIVFMIEDVRNIKDGARIFYKDPKRRILSFFGM
jgi:uncharacterized protein YebE (UPF0316 family)